MSPALSRIRQLSVQALSLFGVTAVRIPAFIKLMSIKKGAKGPFYKAP